MARTKTSRSAQIWFAMQVCEDDGLSPLAFNNKLTNGIADLIRNEMEELESELAALVHTSHRGADELLSRHFRIGEAGRFVPAMHFLSAKMCGHRSSSMVKVGLAIELIRLATAIHHSISENPAHGDEHSLKTLAGDWTYVNALRPVFGLRRFSIMDLLIEMTKRLIEGESFRSELRSGSLKADDSRQALHYHRGACLCSLAAELGAELAGCGTLQKRALADYGLNAGFATSIEFNPRVQVHNQDRVLHGEFTWKALQSLEAFPPSCYKAALGELAKSLSGE